MDRVDNERVYSQRQVLVILSGLLLATFLAGLDQTIVAAAMYKIGESLNGLTAQAWATTAFLMTTTVTMPFYGRLSDQYGRKRLFVVAIAVFVTGSALCSLSTSIYLLAAFRAFQGVGAGGIFTLTSAILGGIVAPRERAKYSGYFIGTYAIASVIGPVVGGGLAGQARLLGVEGWRWIFLVNVPIGIIALMVVTRVLHLDHQPRSRRLDYLGAGTLVLGVVPLLLVAQQGQQWGWASGPSMACYLIGLTGLTGFLWSQARAGDDGLLSLRLFRNRVFAIGVAQSAIGGIGIFGGIVMLPLYLQLAKGYSPTTAGLLILPQVLGMLVCSVLAGQVTSRTGRYKFLPVAGSLVLIASMVMLWRLSAGTGVAYIEVAILLFGAGYGLYTQTITLSVQNSLPQSDLGVATSSNGFFRQMGGTAGAAMFLSIVYSAAPSKIAAVFATARGTAGFLAAAQANPGQFAMLRATSSAISSALNNTSFLPHLNPLLAAPFKTGFTEALTTGFLVAVAVMTIAFVLTMCIEEIPLRSAIAERPAAEPVPAPRGR
jgi:EmrB/QacA subfamily drug resistance transporter